MIVDDGETLMLGGILFKTDNKIQQKIPLLGDLPLLGPLFRHYDNTISNTELLVFITPYVVDEYSSQKTIDEMEENKDKLESVLEELNETIDAQITR